MCFALLCTISTDEFPSLESYQHNSNVSSTILFHFYEHTAHCILYGVFPFNEKKQHQLCETYTYPILLKKLYHKRARHDRVINCGLSLRLLHSRNSKNCISPTTCTHSWNASLWQHVPRGIQ